MLSMIPPQPLPYNLSKVEKIESAPLISSYNMAPYNNNNNNTAYNLSNKSDKETSPPPLLAAYNLSSKPEKIESSPHVASYTGTGTNMSSPSSVGYSPTGAGSCGFTSPNNGGFASPNNGGFASPNNVGFTSPNNVGFTSPNNNAIGFPSPRSTQFSTPSPTPGGYPIQSPTHPYGGPLSPPPAVPDTLSVKTVPSPPPYQACTSPSN